jgi:hypothetical protein
VLLTRRLLAALLLAGPGVVTVGAASAPALGCPAGGGTFQSKTLAADDVFSGAVTARHAQGKRVVYTVSVRRVYKGDVATAEVSVTTKRPDRACGLPRPGRDSPYVFFTQGNDFTTSRGSGTAPATDGRVAKVERLLGDGRTPTPPEPAEASFTTVASEPASFERVAAPGLALVIVGLLGLGLAVGLGRRRG